MEIYLADKPDYDTLLDWNVAVDADEKPLRFLTATDLGAAADGEGVSAALAHAYIAVARILPDGAVIEDLDPADFELAFWGSGAE